MGKRIYFIAGLAALLGFEILCAGESKLLTLIKEEQNLSSQIKKAYLSGRDTSGYFRQLLNVQKKIRKMTKDSEAGDMVRFLDYCLEDLQAALKAPNSRPNEEIVSDLDGSIQEGCCYIGRLSEKQSAL